jgi:glucokinase
MNALFAGVDLGGTTITAGLGTADGMVVARRTAPTRSEEGPTAVLQRIADLVRALADEAGGRPQALGVGAPGLIEVATGRSLFLPNLPTQWRNVPIAATLAARLGCPVRVLNDARVATLGELAFGLGRGARSLVVFTLGTGIGGGVIIDGRLRLGPLGAAGELGHQTILPDGPPCGCGSRGCLESLASGPAITAEGVRLLRAGLAPVLHRITGGSADAVTPRTMGEAAQAGDATVLSAITRAATFLGIGVANVVTMLHPDCVVLSGGVAELGDLLLGPVRQTVRERVRLFPPDDVRIEKSTVGEGAGLLGAIALAARGVDGTEDIPFSRTDS